MSGDGTYFKTKKSKSASDHEVVFLCEGVDDAYFLDELATDEKISAEKLGISYVGGNSKLLDNVINLTKTSSFVNGHTRNIMIFHDIDREGEDLEKFLADLVKNGFPKLQSGSIEEFSFRSSKRKMGFFAIGSNGAGALEDLILQSCSVDPRLHRAKFALDDQISATGALDHYSKRISQIYLSLYPTRWRGVGRAFKAGVFDKSHSSLAEIKEFIGKAMLV